MQCLPVPAVSLVRLCWILLLVQRPPLLLLHEGSVVERVPARGACARWWVVGWVAGWPGGWVRGVGR